MRCTLFSALSLAALSPKSSVEAKEASYILSPDHPSHAWRTVVGHEQPSLDRVVLWTRHEQVGIGNALGGLARVMEDALEENRTLVITSLILQKFCDIVTCGMVPYPDERGYEHKPGIDQTRASHFQISVMGPGPPGLQKWYKAAGCDGPSPLASSEEGREWGRMCFYSQLVRSFVTGPGERLKSEKEWLRQYYVGSPERFDQVMAVDLSAPWAFDITIHIRTLELIEDMDTEDGHATDTAAKAAKYLRSDAFESMVHCFASQVLANTRAKRGVGEDAPMNEFMNSGHRKHNGVKTKKQPARGFSKKSWKASKGKVHHEDTSSNGDHTSGNSESVGTDASSRRQLQNQPRNRRLRNRRLSEQGEQQQQVEGIEHRQPEQQVERRRQLKGGSSIRTSSTSSSHLPHGVKPRVSSSSASEHGTMAVVAAEGLFPQSVSFDASTAGSSSASGGGSGGVITIYLATDALDLREQFAIRLKAAVMHQLSHEHGPAGHGTAGWRVEVDYFSAALPPAMFFTWTFQMPLMKPESWRELVGTTAEWLFLAQGASMLTVKGTSGGEKALPSSFAMSAAAFGKSKRVLYLQGSEPSSSSDIERAAACSWYHIAYFS